MSFKPNLIEQYVNSAGTLTVDGIKVFGDMFERIVTLEAQMAAIAAITAPTGGATTDAEARTAINSIISGAAT